jgi:hypothetical protein
MKPKPWIWPAFVLTSVVLSSFPIQEQHHALSDNHSGTTRACPPPEQPHDHHEPFVPTPTLAVGYSVSGGYL